MTPRDNLVDDNEDSYLSRLKKPKFKRFLTARDDEG